MAELLGHKTYSEYLLQSRMAKTPETVWEFENSLKSALREKSQKDYDELLEMKRSLVPGAEKINGWERSYYSDKLMKEKYQLDSEKVKEYFSLDDRHRVRRHGRGLLPDLRTLRPRVRPGRGGAGLARRRAHV